jgi:betaine-homocysteine S-methyltransferase
MHFSVVHPFQASILQRLDRGEVIIGDGSYVFTLEKRGYVLAGPWTPEAACEHPDAVKQLALEFARAGADITQTFTFYSTDDKLKLINKYLETKFK